MHDYRRLTITTLMVILAIIVFRYYRTSNPSPPQKINDQDVDREMKSHAAEAVKTALDDYGVKLDFTIQSIKEVEGILAKVHTEHAELPLAQSRVVRESLLWGSYIGECIHRIEDVRWGVDSKDGGPGSYPLIFADGSKETFPIRWCYRRIRFGQENNVWIKFNHLIVNPVESTGSGVPSSEQ